MKKISFIVSTLILLIMLKTDITLAGNLDIGVDENSILKLYNTNGNIEYNLSPSKNSSYHTILLPKGTNLSEQIFKFNTDNVNYYYDSSGREITDPGTLSFLRKTDNITITKDGINYEDYIDANGASFVENEFYTICLKGWLPVGESFDAYVNIGNDFIFKMIVAKEYHIIEGNNGKVTEKNNNSYIIKADGDVSKFKNVEVDNNIITTEIESKGENNNTVITFSSDYIANLPVGKYTVKINYEDGSAETTLTVEPVQVVEPSPTPTPSIEPTTSTEATIVPTIMPTNVTTIVPYTTPIPNDNNANHTTNCLIPETSDNNTLTFYIILIILTITSGYIILKRWKKNI